MHMKTLRAIPVFATAMLLAGSLLAQAVRLTKEELPQPVVNAVEKLAPGSTFGGGMRQTAQNGTVKYVVNASQGDDRIRLSLSPEGKLLERSENAKFSELPAPAKQKIEYVCSGEPDMVTKITLADGQPVYKFSIGRLMEEDGSKRAPGQDNLGTMAQVKREELPLPVLNAVNKLDVGGSDWIAVKLGGNNAKYGTSYMIRTNNKKFFVVSPDGQLHESWDMTVKPADLPAPIRTMAERATGAGEETLIKVAAAGKKPYYRFSLSGSVAEDGRLIMEEEH
jgi:hypothetical protein